MFFLCAGPLHNQFCGRVTVYGKMDLVLDSLVEDPGCGSIFVVVDGRGVNVGNLLVCAALTETDFPDFGQQVLKIVLSQEGAILHPLFVDYVATDGELTEDIGAPLAELGGPDAVHAVSDTDNGIEIVKLRLVVLAVGGSCRDFLGN